MQRWNTFIYITKEGRHFTSIEHRDIVINISGEFHAIAADIFILIIIKRKIYFGLKITTFVSITSSTGMVVV